MSARYPSRCSGRPRDAAGRRGFTLVELLVVIAVVALLAGILLPVLESARQKVRQASCLSSAKQLAHAQHLYLQDYDERFPFWYLSGPPRPGPLGGYVFWTEFFQPYLRSQAALREANTAWQPEVPEEQRLASYVLATWGAGGKGTEASPHWNWPGPQVTLAQVRRPTESIVVMDGFTTSRRAIGDLERHHGGLNTGFVDGHARWLPRADLKRVATDDNGAYWLHYVAVDR